MSAFYILEETFFCKHIHTKYVMYCACIASRRHVQYSLRRKNNNTMSPRSLIAPFFQHFKTSLIFPLSPDLISLISFTLYSANGGNGIELMNSKINDYHCKVVARSQHARPFLMETICPAWTKLQFQYQSCTKMLFPAVPDVSANTIDVIKDQKQGT